MGKLHTFSDSSVYPWGDCAVSRICLHPIRRGMRQDEWRLALYKDAAPIMIHVLVSKADPAKSTIPAGCKRTSAASEEASLRS
eukprot:2963747-Amphidinium_carterae.1